MKRVQAFLGGALDFIVGDDWLTAAGVVLALGATALLAGADIAAWWVMPPAVCIILALSLWRTVH
jgi:hypothetical protein